MKKKSVIGTVLALVVGALLVALVVKSSKSGKSKGQSIKGIAVVD
jgi:hypothetical protein